jgi:hypothetical protein
VIEGVDRTLSIISVPGNFKGFDVTSSGVEVRYMGFVATAGQTVSYALLDSNGVNKNVISNCAFSGNLCVGITGSNNYSTITGCSFQYGASPLEKGYAKIASKAVPKAGIEDALLVPETYKRIFNLSLPETQTLNPYSFAIDLTSVVFPVPGGP